jgi:hypothetical protein
MKVLYDHPVAAAFVICGVAYALAFAMLGWPFGGRR